MSSKVEALLTRNGFVTRMWSVIFCPTDGLWTMVLIPKEVSRVLSPIPDSWRRAGVPNDPADSTISRLAFNIKGWAKESVLN